MTFVIVFVNNLFFVEENKTISKMKCTDKMKIEEKKKIQSEPIKLYTKAGRVWNRSNQK